MQHKCVPLLEALKADSYSSHLLRQHGKSFYFARFFLSYKPSRKANALYTLCRILDDIVDSGDHTKGDALAQLNALKVKINSDSFEDKVKISHDFLVTKTPLVDLLEGMYMDIAGVSIKTEKDLLKYAYHVAGTVGLMMCDIFEIQDPSARQHAIDLGVAMQLTNISRDVEADAKMGRIYLPHDWLGLDNCQDILKPNRNSQAKIIFAIKKTLNLSEHYYKSGFSGLSYIPFRQRFSILVAAKLYRAIGDKVKALNFYQLGARAYVPFKEKLQLTVGSLYDFVNL